MTTQTYIIPLITWLPNKLINWRPKTKQKYRYRSRLQRRLSWSNVGKQGSELDQIQSILGYCYVYLSLKCFKKHLREQCLAVNDILCHSVCVNVAVMLQTAVKQAAAARCSEGLIRQRSVIERSGHYPEITDPWIWRLINQNQAFNQAM